MCNVDHGLSPKSAAGSLPDGYGIDDGAAAHFIGTNLERCSNRGPGAKRLALPAKGRRSNRDEA